MEVIKKSGKTSTGKKKIAIERIEDKSKSHVTFSKRHNGLFKKTAELCSLTGAEAAVITFTRAGKPYSFGNPSPESVIHRYLNVSSPCNDLEAAGTSSGTLGGGAVWWDQPIEGLGLDELQRLKERLQALREQVGSRINDEFGKTSQYCSSSIKSSDDVPLPITNCTSLEGDLLAEYLMNYCY